MFGSSFLRFLLSQLSFFKYLDSSVYKFVFFESRDVVTVASHGHLHDAWQIRVHIYCAPGKLHPDPPFVVIKYWLLLRYPDLVLHLFDPYLFHFFLYFCERLLSHNGILNVKVLPLFHHSLVQSLRVRIVEVIQLLQFTQKSNGFQLTLSPQRRMEELRSKISL